MKSWREFYQAGKQVHDWTTDGCSGAPDKFFFDVNLHGCCAEHDFYYRNDVGVSRWTADCLLHDCIFKAVWKKYGLVGLIPATIYWAGVRVGGASSYHSYVDHGWGDDED